MRVLEQLTSAMWGKGWSVSWVAPPVFYFLLAGLEQHREWEGVSSFFGIVALGSRKPILAQDWFVCWGEVLGLCEKSSSGAASELFDLCDSMPWDAAAGLLFLGVMLCKRTSHGSWRDGGKLFSFCTF